VTGYLWHDEVKEPHLSHFLLGI